MFERLFVWILDKISRKKRKYLLKKFSFIKKAKKYYDIMEKQDKFKADSGYINLAKIMKENVYPRFFEAMERHGFDHIILVTRNIKDFKIDIDGLVSIKTNENNGWEQLGNAINDKWEPIIRLCHRPENINSYTTICESIMDKLDELMDNDIRNRELCERAKKFGTVYERKVITEKFKK